MQKQCGMIAFSTTCTRVCCLCKFCHSSRDFLKTCVRLISDFYMWLISRKWSCNYFGSFIIKINFEKSNSAISASVRNKLLKLRFFYFLKQWVTENIYSRGDFHFILNNTSSCDFSKISEEEYLWLMNRMWKCQGFKWFLAWLCMCFEIHIHVYFSRLLTIGFADHLYELESFSALVYCTYTSGCLAKLIYVCE